MIKDNSNNQDKNNISAIINIGTIRILKTEGNKEDFLIFSVFEVKTNRAKKLKILIRHKR